MTQLLKTAHARRRPNWGMAAAVAGVLYLWLAVPVKTHDVLAWEMPLREALLAWQRPWVDSLMRTVAWFGQAMVLVPATVGVAFIGRQRWGNCAWLAVALAATAPLVNEALTWWVARGRPSAPEYGFPSGETFLATLVLGLAVVAVWAATTSGSVRAGSVVVAAALLGGVAMGRVYLGLHWPADVVGGVLAGAAYLSVAMWLFSRRLAGDSHQSPRSSSKPGR